MKSQLASPLDQALGFNSEALKLRVQRQQLIASNIANADTPGYKAQDFDFKSRLRQAVEANSSASPGATQPARTSPLHLQSTSAFAGISTKRDANAQPSADRNTVDMDVERARFAENAVRYEASLKFLNGQIRTMLSAIQGQ